MLSVKYKCVQGHEKKSVPVVIQVEAAAVE